MIVIQTYDESDIIMHAVLYSVYREHILKVP